jgi:protein gp37
MPGPRIDLVIDAGESGSSKVRPTHPAWFRSLRDQCAAAGAAYFHKQNGAWSTTGAVKARTTAVDLTGRTAEGVLRQNFPKNAESADGWQTMYFVGKKAAGRELAGRTHDEFPA